MKKNCNAIDAFAADMTILIWRNIGKEIESRGYSIRGISAKAGVDHATVLYHIRDARQGKVPQDIKLESYDRLCKALGRPLSYFMH